jgi:hypothetical protein
MFTPHPDNHCRRNNRAGGKPVDGAPAIHANRGDHAVGPNSPTPGGDLPPRREQVAATLPTTCSSTIESCNQRPPQCLPHRPASCRRIHATLFYCYY